MTTELKPCPFCLSAPKLIRTMGDKLRTKTPPFYGGAKYRYTCTGEACCAMSGCFHTEQQAREHWNTRATPDVPELMRYDLRNNGQVIGIQPSHRGPYVRHDQAAAMIAAEKAYNTEVLFDLRSYIKRAEAAEDELAQINDQKPVAFAGMDADGNVEIIGMEETGLFDTPLYAAPVASDAETIERLREALKPFAKLVEYYRDTASGDIPAESVVPSIGDLRRARAALSGKEPS